MNNPASGKGVCEVRIQNPLLSINVILLGHPEPFLILNNNFTVKSETIEKVVKLTVSPAKAKTLN
jgi:hypothetical protein